MPALVAARFNPDIKAKYTHVINIGKLAKVASTAVMRKLIVTVNALLKANRLWAGSMALPSRLFYTQGDRLLSLIRYAGKRHIQIDAPNRTWQRHNI